MGRELPFRFKAAIAKRCLGRDGPVLSFMTVNAPKPLKLLMPDVIKRVIRGMREERGFALLIVVAVLMALSLMVGAVISATQSYTRITSSRLALLQLRAALDAGLATESRGLLQPLSAGSSQGEDRKNFQIADISVDVAVRPEVAKIDINAANPVLIEQLLLASGLAQTYSHRVADQIADWRGQPGRTRPPVVEAADYVSAGRSYVPPHRNFETLADLALLLDGNSDLVTCLATDITLYTHSGDVDFSAASSRVRKAVAAAMPKAGLRPSLTSAGVVGGSAGRPDLYEVTETAKDEESQTTLTRQVVLRITGDPRHPIWILSEVSPAPDAVEAQAACTRLKILSASLK